MEKNITKKYLINGPTNVIRLKNGDKIIYIFGEYHVKYHLCSYNDKYNIIDIDNFLLEFMKSEKK